MRGLGNVDGLTDILARWIQDLDTDANGVWEKLRSWNTGPRQARALFDARGIEPESLTAADAFVREAQDTLSAGKAEEAKKKLAAAGARLTAIDLSNRR